MSKLSGGSCRRKPIMGKSLSSSEMPRKRPSCRHLNRSSLRKMPKPPRSLVGDENKCGSWPFCNLPSERGRDFCADHQAALDHVKRTIGSQKKYKDGSGKL